jgi:putative toxin-antitoxin system antitoxin component (TIGR02293 family)
MSTTIFQPSNKVVYVEGAVVLGLKIHNMAELIQHLEQGFKPGVVTELAKQMRVPIEDFLTMSGISSRSVKMALKNNRPLSREKSAMLYRVGRILEQTVKVFHGNKEQATRWLTNPKFGLNNEVPLSFARTEPGGAMVRALLEELIDGGVA